MSYSFARTCAQLTLASVLLAGSVSTLAQSITLTPQLNGNGPLETGSTQTLTLGPGMLDFLNATKAQVASAGAPITIMQDLEGGYTHITTTGTVTSAQMNLFPETGKESIQSVSDSNSISFLLPKTQSFSGGGQLTISNLTADFATRRVFGDINGTGLATLLTHVHLWDAGALDSVITGQVRPGMMASTLYTVVLSDLTLTNTALGIFNESLSLGPLGSGFLEAANTPGQGLGGSLTAALNLSGLPSEYVAPIPEPGTWALMSLGLTGLLGVSRRRQQA